MDNSSKMDILNEAARTGNLEKARELLKADPDLNRREDKQQNTALHYAAAHGRKDLAEVLLVNGADIHAKNKERNSPLHVATRHGHRDVVEFLLANKADVDGTGEDSYTALHIAAKNGHRHVAAVLLANKANPTIGAPRLPHFTPLYWAVYHGHSEVVELLLANGVEGNEELFHLAIRNGYKEVAKLLIANKTDQRMEAGPHLMWRKVASPLEPDREEVFDHLRSEVTGCTICGVTEQCDGWDAYAKIEHAFSRKRGSQTTIFGFYRFLASTQIRFCGRCCDKGRMQLTKDLESLRRQQANESFGKRILRKLAQKMSKPRRWDINSKEYCILTMMRKLLDGDKYNFMLGFDLSGNVFHMEAYYDPLPLNPTGENIKWEIEPRLKAGRKLKTGKNGVLWVEGYHGFASDFWLPAATSLIN